MTLADAPESTVMPRLSFSLLVPILVALFNVFTLGCYSGNVYMAMPRVCFRSFGRSLNGRDTDGTRDS